MTKKQKTLVFTLSTEMDRAINVVRQQLYPHISQEKLLQLLLERGLQQLSEEAINPKQHTKEDSHV